MDRWTRWLYPMQEGDPDPAGGGDPPPGGDPPAPDLKTIPVDVLPEDMRDKPAAEVKFLLGRMIDTYGAQVNQVNSLQQQLSDLKARVDHPLEPPKPDPHEGKSLNDLILEDAEAALDRWAQKKGYVNTVSDLGNRVGEAEMTMLRQELDDFDKYEDDIRKYIKDSGVAMTRGNIVAAYKLTLADSILADRKKGDRRDNNMEPPSPPVPPKNDDTPQLSALEQEFMRASGIDDPKEWVALRDAEVAEIKVPTNR